MISTYRLFCILCLLSLNCAAQQIVKSGDPLVHYNGRVMPEAAYTRLEWPGTSVKVQFIGSEITADLKDEQGKNRFNVLVDGKVTQILTLDNNRREYVLARGLPEGDHTVELFKRTEAGMGGTLFYGFKLNNHAKVSKILARKRRIEFYGNSITCGMAIGDTLKDGIDENNYMAYGALVARSFDADYSCIAKSGIGLMVSWFPEIMPEIYDRVYELNANAKWDFSRYDPQIVVVDLGQNDSWIVNQPQNEQFKRRFGSTSPTSSTIVNAYVSFFTKLRNKYPKAQIICTMGSMDATKDGSPWPGYLQEAVKRMQDSKMVSLIFPYDPPQGKQDAHPGFKEHQKMADLLKAFIHQTAGW
jgi:hypothetical protein